MKKFAADSLKLSALLISLLITISFIQHPKNLIQNPGFETGEGKNPADWNINCGFNSFAGWSADGYAQISKERFKTGKPYMPMTRVLGLSSASNDPNVFAKDRDGNLLNRSGHEVVDPFISPCHIKPH